MQAVEFEATIENGIVRIPPQYEELNNTKATFVVIYEGARPEPNKNTNHHSNSKSHKSNVFGILKGKVGNPVEWQRSIRNESDRDIRI